MKPRLTYPLVKLFLLDGDTYRRFPLTICFHEFQKRYTLVNGKNLLLTFPQKTAKISVKKLNQFLTVCKGHHNIG
jgi:hypothetical protein